MVKNSWNHLLAEEFEKPYFLRLQEFLNQEYADKTIYPLREEVYQALELTDYEDVKVVILGQDPYHGPGQAHGLSFSVKPGVTIPPSLRNILKELQDDIGSPTPKNGHLIKWAEQGVLLLNTVLTVREGDAHSHQGKGWEIFTDKIISLLNERKKPVIFILWGKPAQSKRKWIDEQRHFIVSSPHPSPLSARRGFFGSRPFSKANELLEAQGQEAIDWNL